MEQGRGRGLKWTIAACRHRYPGRQRLFRRRGNEIPAATFAGGYQAEHALCPDCLEKALAELGET